MKHLNVPKPNDRLYDPCMYHCNIIAARLLYQGLQIITLNLQGEKKLIRIRAIRVTVSKQRP